MLNEQPRHPIRQIQRKHLHALVPHEVCNLADRLFAQTKALPLAFRAVLALLDRVPRRMR